jgi:DNA-binding beta-propeller fold protein YncE
MDWPGMMSVDPATGDLFVANDLGSSVLVFRETDKGDIAPYRVIQGSKTHLSNPTGLFVDAKNRELWVSNLGNSSAIVFALNASGNQAPLRTIRTAPADKVSLKFGKPSGTAYDSKREQLLVAN